MKKTVIFLLAVAVIFCLLDADSAHAEENGILSHGNLVYGEKMGFYSQDFSYLYGEIAALKAECN